MSARLMVLGVIQQEKKAHGYMVVRTLDAWKAQTWSKVRPGSVYHALAQMEKEGLLKNLGVGSSEKGPAHTSYRLTAKGRTALGQLVEKALLEYDQEWFAAGLAFMHLLPRKRAVALARQRLEMFDGVCNFMRMLPKKFELNNPSTHPEIIDSWTSTFDATTAWMKGYVRHLEAGRYVFADEGKLRER